VLRAGEGARWRDAAARAALRAAALAAPGALGLYAAGVWLAARPDLAQSMLLTLACLAIGVSAARVWRPAETRV
jgi:hypothetical protein